MVVLRSRLARYLCDVICQKFQFIRNQSISSMRTILFLGTAFLVGTGATAQNTAVVNQSGGQHDVSVVQSGKGNSSVVSQNTGGKGNRAVISQSGSGNVATVTQGGSHTSTGGQSVNVSQSGNTETHINQTDEQNNHIIINQTGDVAPSTPPAENTPPKRGKRNAKKSGQ